MSTDQYIETNKPKSVRNNRILVFFRMWSKSRCDYFFVSLVAVKTDGMRAAEHTVTQSARYEAQHCYL